MKRTSKLAKTKQVRPLKPVWHGFLPVLVSMLVGCPFPSHADEPPIGNAIAAATRQAGGPSAPLARPGVAAPNAPASNDVNVNAAETDNDADADMASHPGLNDPLEPFNRAMFRFDMELDRWVLKPTAKGYRTVLPGPVQNSIRNFFDNLETPIILVNSMLQGNWARAGGTLERFAWNTTLGVAGFFDPATKRGLTRYEEDLGQTLGVWGMGEGPYLVWPLLGPMPPRDALGWAGDKFLDPWTYIFWDSAWWPPLAVNAVDITDKRSRNIETVDQIERTSLDFYAAVRSLYRQKRDSEIKNAEGGAASAPPVSAKDFEFDDQEPAHP